MTDSSPFQLLTEAFQAEYRVNLSLERPDGSIVLTLSNERGVAAKRLIRNRRNCMTWNSCSG